MKKFISEFKEFASRGNVFEMAIGIVLGTTFTAIVNSLVNDIIIPIISSFTFKVNLSALKIVISKSDNTVVSINYGAFLQTIVDFLVVAFCIFIVIKVLNKLKLKRSTDNLQKDSTVSEETKALREIVDLLNKNTKH